MIVTCASCLTKFHLDDSKIPAEGAKVRCSRCRHVFRIAPPPPPETREDGERVEDFESFAKSHEDVIDPGLRSGSSEWKGESLSTEEAKAPNLEEPLPVPEDISLLPEEYEDALGPSREETPARANRTKEGRWGEEEKTGGKISQPLKMVGRKRRGLSLLVIVFVVLVLLIFGAFYLWTELESTGSLAQYAEAPVKKVTLLWNKLWKTEKAGLVIHDLSGYEEKAGDMPLFVIEGKVNNQSRFTKKYIKIKVSILDQDKTEMATREAICGPTISRDDLKSLPAVFFQSDIALKPQTEKEMIVPANTSIPFFVIFKDVSLQAREFKVDIVEAPNL